MTDELNDIWGEAVDIESSELKPRVPSFALELESRPWVMDRILDVLELELVRDKTSKEKEMLICSKAYGACVPAPMWSHSFAKPVDAVLFLLSRNVFWNYIDGEEKRVCNVFYGCKCIEEILVKLDLAGDAEDDSKDVLS